MPEPRIDREYNRRQESPQLSLPETEFTGELLPWTMPEVEAKEPTELEQSQESAGVTIPASLIPRVEAIMDEASQAVDRVFAQGDTNKVLARRRAAEQVGESALLGEDIEEKEKRQDAKLRSARRLHEPKTKRSRRTVGDGVQTKSAEDLIVPRPRTESEFEAAQRARAEGLARALQEQYSDRRDLPPAAQS